MNVRGAMTMSPPDAADLILDILVHDLALKPGQIVPDQMLKKKFTERGGRHSEIGAGLKYAHVQDWLDFDHDKQAFSVTNGGFERAD